MTPEEAKKVIGNFSTDTEIRLFEEYWEAKGFLEGIEYQKSLPVCDCHTWVTTKELHDYTVALEKRVEKLVELLKLVRLAEKDVYTRTGTRFSFGQYVQEGLEEYEKGE